MNSPVDQGPVFNLDMLRSALATAKAGRLELLMARVFGKKFEAKEGGHVVAVRQWRGRLYMTGYRQTEAAPKAETGT